MQAGYVVSYDSKRGLGFIQAADSTDGHNAKQLSKYVEDRAKQAEVLMFRAEAIVDEQPLEEGLLVMYEVGETEETEGEEVWTVASKVVLDVVPDEAAAPEAVAVGAAAETEADAAPAEEAAAEEAAVEEWAKGYSGEDEAKMRDVGFSTELSDDWDAAVWENDSES